MSDEYLVDHNIPADPKEAKVWWAAKLNKEVMGDFTLLLPGMTNWRITTDDNSDIRVFTLTVWYGDERCNASMAVGRDLWFDNIFRLSDPYADVAYRLLNKLTEGKHGARPSDAGSDADGE